jgi:tRNA pseudouridine55 synthase
MPRCSGCVRTWAVKAGHTGSLTVATGMLPICIGEATKVAGGLLVAQEFTVELAGRSTDTGDAGAVVERCRCRH